ncbi:MAG: hypothetical protein LUF92_17250 [Clostridiales bacterium]|nr:hypothetical protein [Clostridiales bacterium]
MVSDNGCGCPDITEGFGLRHMRERVELAGGTLFYQGDFGFTVIVKIPMPSKTIEASEKSSADRDVLAENVMADKNKEKDL